MAEDGRSSLERSFIFLPGVGVASERRLWEEGIDHWYRFLETDIAGSIRSERKARCDHMIEETSRRLGERDLEFFSGLFKGADSWRLWDTFSGKAAYLDIETTGTRRNSPITVVGVYDGKEYRTAIRGKDMGKERIREILSDAEILVTFNGASFDIPMIEYQFPGSVPDIPHLDLRFLARRCGLTGGLKRIEIAMGISRPEDVQGMSGEDAVRLWKLYEKGGNRNALKLLLKYNLEDIANLKPMTGTLVEQIKKRTFI